MNTVRREVFPRSSLSFRAGSKFSAITRKLLRAIAHGITASARVSGFSQRAFGERAESPWKSGRRKKESRPNVVKGVATFGFFDTPDMTSTSKQSTCGRVPLESPTGNAALSSVSCRERRPMPGRSPAPERTNSVFSSSLPSIHPVSTLQWPNTSLSGSRASIPYRIQLLLGYFAIEEAYALAAATLVPDLCLSHAQQNEGNN